MKQTVAVFLRFTVTYVSAEGGQSTWNYYADLYPSGTIRVYDPAFKVQDCKKHSYYSGKVFTSITNKCNRYFYLESIIQEFANIATRECFYPFKELHFGYKNAYVPQIDMKVKMGKDLYEHPLQIKADRERKWMTVDSANKHLTINANRTIRTMRDE